MAEQGEAEQGSAPTALMDSVSSVAEETQQEVATIIDFPWGEAFTPLTARLITQQRPTRLIIIAGGVKSGKSTLLGTIYEKFYSGLFADYRFAGSKTLLEFERICHDSRIASNRTNPETERTKYTSDFRLLHLEVQNTNTNKKHDILFTDITGEIFDDIRDSSDECQRHPILLRCDHFALCLDGEKLSNALTRGKEISDGVMIIRRLLDMEILGKHSFVDILFTKLDIVAAAEREDGALKTYIEDIKVSKFQKLFSSRVSKLSISDIAARPDALNNSELNLGYGIDALLNRWVECYPSSRIKKIEEVKVYPRIRAIDKFTLTHDDVRI
jgi:hypothetical protein